MILENLLILEFLNEFQSGMQGPLSAGPCVRVAGHGMKKISTGMTLLLHFKLRALSVPHVGIDSGSSTLEINVTARSTSMCPRVLSGIQHCAASCPFPIREFRPLRSSCSGTKKTHCQKIALVLGFPGCFLLHKQRNGLTSSTQRMLLGHDAHSAGGSTSIPGAELPDVHHITPWAATFKVTCSSFLICSSNLLSKFKLVPWIFLLYSQMPIFRGAIVAKTIWLKLGWYCYNCMSLY